MSFNQYKRVLEAGTSYLSSTDLFVEVDTTLGVATIYLPKISELFALFSTNNLYSFNGIRFTDLARNAAVNNIIFRGKDGDLVNGLSEITLNTNGVGGILTPISDTGWSLTINNIASGGSTVPLQIGASVNGLGSAIQVGSLGFSVPAFSGTIQSWSVIGDFGAIGDVVIDVRRNGVSIVGAGNKPTITAANNDSASIAGWTSDTIVAGDYIEYVIESVSVFKTLNLVLNIS
jgi:hypothetical protein